MCIISHQLTKSFLKQFLKLWATLLNTAPTVSISEKLVMQKFTCNNTERSLYTGTDPRSINEPFQDRGVFRMSLYPGSSSISPSFPYMKVNTSSFRAGGRLRQKASAIVSLLQTKLSWDAFGRQHQATVSSVSTSPQWEPLSLLTLSLLSLTFILSDTTPPFHLCLSFPFPCCLSPPVFKFSCVSDGSEYKMCKFCRSKGST